VTVLLSLLAVAAALAGCGSSTSTVTVTTAATPTPRSHRSASGFPSLIARVKSGVIRIETSACDASYVGTGILIGPRLVATVEHVVEGSSSIALKRNGRVIGRGTVIGVDPTRDVALVRSDRPITGYEFSFATRAPLLGESVAAIGYPLGLPLTVTRGSVSGDGRTVPIDGVNRSQLVQTDASVNPGNSGGPLISNSGAVLGLVDLRRNGASGLAFAVSAPVAAPLIQSWRTAPQPIPSQNCTNAAEPTQPTESLLSYTGRDFAIDYPSSWRVSHLSEGGGNLDTTFSPPGQTGVLLRVDENPNAPAGLTPEAGASSVIAALERDPSYVNLGTTNESFDSYPAFRWEFEVTEDGRRMHKVDEFFIDSEGHGWGILVQAPASLWDEFGPSLDGLRQTFDSNAHQRDGAQGALGDWPGGTGYTVILASKGSETEARTIQAEASASGLDAGVLFSSDFRSLRPGYWVVFSGIYDSQSAAAQAATDARDIGFSDAYSRFVSP
jgi:S1-C subfamily serine protease